LPIILAHHERYDGEGYPNHLKGQGIPLLARIMAAADAYDAMTSERLYCSAFSHERAAAELEAGSGIQWDPEVINAFLVSLRNLPIGPIDAN
jgi:HD-GYP domain-containing protein (c-di-GMP phosphodiesterase class II)